MVQQVKAIQSNMNKQQRVGLCGAVLYFYQHQGAEGIAQLGHDATARGCACVHRGR